MPAQSEKLERLQAEAGEYEMPYLSKSRVMQWKKNPEHFRLKYLEGIREEETEAMVRGTRIHEGFEEYYHNLRDDPDADDEALLADDTTLWADFIEPVSNFLTWEQKRRETAGEAVARTHAQMDDAELSSGHEEATIDSYLPVGIEAEQWRSEVLGIEAEPPWMGIADAVLPSASLEEVPSDTGVTIVDFKTGSVPNEQYRNDGIFTELAYYEIVFEEEYDITGTAAYYPTHDELLVRETGTAEAAAQREAVFSAARDLVEACRSYTGDEKFEINPGPLCKWSFDDEDESAYYGVCSQCDWAVPAKNKNTFKAMIDEGYAPHEIAEELGCSTDAVYYWKRKFNA